MGTAHQELLYVNNVAYAFRLVTTLCVVTQIPNALRLRASITSYGLTGFVSVTQSVPAVRPHAERGDERVLDGFCECLL